MSYFPRNRNNQNKKSLLAPRLRGISASSNTSFFLLIEITVLDGSLRLSFYRSLQSQFLPGGFLPARPQCHCLRWVRGNFCLEFSSYWKPNPATLRNSSRRERV